MVHVVPDSTAAASKRHARCARPDRASQAYALLEGDIVQSFVAAGFDIGGEILFNSTAHVLFSNGTG